MLARGEKEEEEKKKRPAANRAKPTTHLIPLAFPLALAKGGRGLLKLSAASLGLQGLCLVSETKMGEDKQAHAGPSSLLATPSRL